MLTFVLLFLSCFVLFKITQNYTFKRINFEVFGLTVAVVSPDENQGANISRDTIFNFVLSGVLGEVMGTPQILS